MTVFDRSSFLPGLIWGFISICVSAQALWPSSSWCCVELAQHLPAPLTSLNLATAAARPWTWGRYAWVRLVSLSPSLFLTGSHCHNSRRRGSVITESCWDVTCEVAWLLWGEQGEIVSNVCSAASVCIVHHSASNCGWTYLRVAQLSHPVNVMPLCSFSVRIHFEWRSIFWWDKIKFDPRSLF